MSEEIKLEFHCKTATKEEAIKMSIDQDASVLVLNSDETISYYASGKCIYENVSPDLLNELNN